MAPDKKLIRLYRKIADLTMDVCKKSCTRLGSCCSIEYCEMAIEIAKDDWGLELQRTENDKLPLLGPDGNCIAPPHVRPLCSRHQCDMNGLGFFKDDMPRTLRYFSLCEQADALDWAMFDKRIKADIIDS